MSRKSIQLKHIESARKKQPAKPKQAVKQTAKVTKRTAKPKAGKLVAHGLNSISWPELQKLASKAKVLKRGMGRGEVTKALLTQEAIDNLKAA